MAKNNEETTKLKRMNEETTKLKRMNEETTKLKRMKETTKLKRMIIITVTILIISFVCFVLMYANTTLSNILIFAAIILGGILGFSVAYIFRDIPFKKWNKENERKKRIYSAINTTYSIFFSKSGLYYLFATSVCVGIFSWMASQEHDIYLLYFFVMWYIISAGLVFLYILQKKLKKHM